MLNLCVSTVSRCAVNNWHTTRNKLAHPYWCTAVLFRKVAGWGRDKYEISKLSNIIIIFIIFYELYNRFCVLWWVFDGMWLSQHFLTSLPVSGCNPLAVFSATENHVANPQDWNYSNVLWSAVQCHNVCSDLLYSATWCAQICCTVPQCVLWSAVQCHTVCSDLLYSATMCARICYTVPQCVFWSAVQCHNVCYDLLYSATMCVMICCTVP